MLEKQQMIIQKVSNGFIVVSPVGGQGGKAIVCTTIDEACDIVKKESAEILAKAETSDGPAQVQESNPDDSQE